MTILDTLAREFAGILARLRGEVERSLSLQLMAEQVMGQLNGMADVAGTWAQVNDFFTEADGSISVVFSMGGKLYKAPVTMSGTTAILGSITEVEPMFSPVRSIEIVRQADGSLRWLAVAAASVLNRSGEIDSRGLFDSFVAAVADHGYPQLRFYHDARLVLGQADWVGREDNLYLASGTLDGGDLSTAFVDAVEKQRGVWGCSIGFMPRNGPQMVEVANGLSIPVYAAGVNTEISVLPEAEAASWFTSIGLEVTRNMEDAKLKALAVLLGDEERAKKFAAGIDATNRSISEQGLITRQEPAVEDAPVTEAPPVVVNVVTSEATTDVDRHATSEAEKAATASAEQKAKDEAELADRILAKVNERLTHLEEVLAKLTDDGKERLQERADSDKRLAAMEVIVTRWQQERDADMPAARTLSATYRPREANAQAAPPGKLDLSAAADKTLSTMKTK